MKLNLKSAASFLGLGLATALVVVPLETSLISRVTGTDVTVAQAQQQQSLVLALAAHKRTTRTNILGQPEVVWESLEGGLLRPAPRVQPGDVVRYTISGNNQTEQPISGLVLTDDIPPNAVYIMNSAAVEGGGKAIVTYSIDSGRTYNANPTITVTLPDGKQEVRPAPANLYTHVRWTFQSPVAARSTLSGVYQVRVQ
jgi:uncharacterized repeat protein (TIGR01451 family)